MILNFRNGCEHNFLTSCFVGCRGFSSFRTFKGFSNGTLCFCSSSPPVHQINPIRVLCTVCIDEILDSNLTLSTLRTTCGVGPPRSHKHCIFVIYVPHTHTLAQLPDSSHRSHDDNTCVTKNIVFGCSIVEYFWCTVSRLQRPVAMFLAFRRHPFHRRRSSR